MAKNPQQVAQKWANNLGSSTAAIEAGVNAVQTAPTQLAKAKKAKMLANLTKAVQDGTWERGLDRVTLADWRTAMISKGIPRVGQGAQAAQGNFAEFMADMLPYQETLATQVKAMPDVTLDDNLNRMVAWARGMAKYQRS